MHKSSCLRGRDSIYCLKIGHSLDFGIETSSVVLRHNMLWMIIHHAISTYSMADKYIIAELPDQILMRDGNPPPRG